MRRSYITTAFFVTTVALAPVTLRAQAAPAAPQSPAGCVEGRPCDRVEDRRDRREDVRDRAENRRDRREDVRDARVQGGARDRIEDRRDAREDVRDRREDVRDRTENRKERRREASTRRKP